ncbi:hypothetical protein D3872_19890 [Massilia cavernae]|uniref:Uncharacterized protein n=2 Tax=Massilia cavernae TaxID=2320864 RepID=A0A418XG09_9BURK|nr:hypothetical protein D3872_19890 [Massilia cavernae]
MACDRIGNLLLTKFACNGARDTSIHIPATIVFWLLKHLPVNQDPNLPQPPGLPRIDQYDWEDPSVVRAYTVNCKQFHDAIRMTFAMEQGPDLTVLLNRSNVELMRQMMNAYSKDLIDLEVQ